MDRQSIKFDWNRARAFLVTAEEGSLSGAARALGLTQPTLGRQVTALEEELGVTLFERVGRGLVLTQSGADLLEHFQVMGESASQISLAAFGRSQNLEGKVRISVSEIYAVFKMPAIVAKIRKAYPGISIEVIASNEVSDLQRREADIAIRSFRPTQTELIARKLRETSGSFYATRDYLRTIGPTNSLQDLSAAQFVSIGNTSEIIKYLKAVGLELSESNFPVQSDSHIVHWEMAKQGLGIGMAPIEIGDSDPKMDRVLPEFEGIPFPVWLVSHRELRTSKRIHLVFDLLAQEFA